MFLKNYTSNVPVNETIARIEKVLIRSKVSGITKEYGPAGKVAAVTFRIELPNQNPWTVRLPANEEKALLAMWLDYADGDKLTPDGLRLLYNNRKAKCKHDFREQAERTAWKIIQDWIEVQMSMIQMQQADWREVFLPYVWDGRQTLFQRMENNGFRALLPETTQ